MDQTEAKWVDANFAQILAYGEMHLDRRSAPRKVARKSEKAEPALALVVATVVRAIVTALQLWPR